MTAIETVIYEISVWPEFYLKALFMMGIVTRYQLLNAKNLKSCFIYSGEEIHN